LVFVRAHQFGQVGRLREPRSIYSDQKCIWSAGEQKIKYECSSVIINMVAIAYRSLKSMFTHM
jgi:hypothetical protein